LTANLIVAKGVSSNLKAIFIPKSFSLTLDMVRKVENELIFEKNITGMTDKETFDDYISFLSEITDQLKELLPEVQTEIAPKLVRLCSALAINDFGLTDACTNSLHYCLDYAHQTLPDLNIKEVLGLKTPAHFKKFASEFKAKALNDNSLPVLTLLKDSIVVIKIRSDAKIAEKSQELSENAYNKDMWKIGKLINLKINLKNRRRKTKVMKLIPKRLENPFTTAFIQNAIDSPQVQSIKILDFKRFFTNANVNLEQFAAISQSYGQISKFLATNYQFNTFEYTYILDLLTAISQLASDLQANIEEATTNKKVEVELANKTFSNTINAKLTSIMAEYDQWWSTRNQNNKSAAKSSQNVKLTRLKWQEEAFMLRMQKIAKKRRAIIKREILEDKAFFKKN
jgi:hypothetical protein